MKKYLKVYWQVLKHSINTLLEYRFNVVINASYAFTYMFGVWVMLKLMFGQVNSLAGFREVGIQIFYCISMITWACSEFLYAEGFRHFMTNTIRTGDFDLLLTKPIHSQFQVAISKNLLESFPQIVVGILALMYYFVLYAQGNFFVSIFTFLIVYCLSLIVVYNYIAIYSSIAFHSTQAMELLRINQSLNDQAHNPPAMYPTFVQFVFAVIFPIGFMAFIPGLFLLGKGSWWLFLVTIGAALLTSYLNSLAWNYGLRHYNSASS